MDQSVSSHSSSVLSCFHFWLGMISIIMICFPATQPACAADSVEVQDVVARYTAQRNRLNTLKAVARITVLHDGKGPIAPAAAKWHVEVELQDSSRQSRVRTSHNKENGSQEETDLYADYSTGKLHIERDDPRIGQYGTIEPPVGTGGRIRLSHDLKPWLLLSFPPMFDPRLSVQDLLTYSTSPPKASTTADGKVRLDVGWPSDASIPSAKIMTGRLAIVFDPTKNYTAVQVEKSYRYLDDKKPVDPNQPFPWLHRVTVTKWAFDKTSGIHMPMEVDIESFSVDAQSAKTLVYRELVTVVDFQINKPLEDGLGFRYEGGTIVHVMGSKDGSIADKYAVYRPDGTPAATFENQGDAATYQEKYLGNKKMRPDKR